MKPWEFKPKREFTSASKVEDLHRWAAAVLEGRPYLWLTTPETPDETHLLACDVISPDELLFYRLRAEAWGSWGTVRFQGKVLATWGDVPAHELVEREMASA